MSENIANRDEAFKCIAIANRAVITGDLEKADKFARKAHGMFPSQQTAEAMGRVASRRAAVREELARARAQQASSNGHASGAAPSGQTHTRGQAAATAGQGARRRPAAAAAVAHAEPVIDETAGTEEQRLLVKQILSSSSYYEALCLVRSASDDDIRRAYRKLALKLHPDKNQAAHASEAFKKVSKAYDCLSDLHKRSYYDRTGYEDAAAHRAAHSQAAARRSAQQQQQQTYMRGTRQTPPFTPTASYFYTSGEEFNADEIFRAFFGASFPSRSSSQSTQFPGSQSHAVRSQQAAQAARRRRETAQRHWQEQQEAAMPRACALIALLVLLGAIVAALVAYGAAAGSSSSWSLQHSLRYAESMTTSSLSVQFYVRRRREFDRVFPKYSLARRDVEQQIEGAYLEFLTQRCHHERQHRNRLAARWSTREEAKAMRLHKCDELEALSRTVASQGRPSMHVRPAMVH